MRGLGREGARIVAGLLIAAWLGAGSACRDASGGGDGAGDDASVTDAAPGDASGPDPAPAADAPSEAGHASASIDATTLVFPALNCGGSPSTLPLQVKNSGSGGLAVSATVVGAGFAVSPPVLDVAPGATGTLSISAVAAASAGPMLAGSLELFTNDPASTHVSVSLTGTPTGPTLSLQSAGAGSFAFPTTEVHVPAAPLSLTLLNSGNAPGDFTFSAPSDARFAFMSVLDGGAQTVTVVPGGVVALTAEFIPTDTSAVTATATVTASTPTCGDSLQTIAFSGQGTFGVVSGWPSVVDFGAAGCGGAAPAPQSFTLSNAGPVDAVITAVRLTGAAGFGTDIKVGRTIVAGGMHTVQVTAPVVPEFAPLTPVTATLALQTDADPVAHLITLSEEPSGAVLAFDTSATTDFGSFGPVVLLRSASESFRVTNTGNGSANVTLVSAPTAPGGDGGAAASVFDVSPASIVLSAGATQDEVVTFAPTAAPAVTGQLTLTATGAVCGALPAALPLSGSGVGGAPTLTSTGLVFGAPCGGAAPPPQSFMVRNDGDADMTWSLEAITGAGAGQYSLQVAPPPGLLAPGASATVVVTAAAVPSPATNPSPSAYAAQLTITTDVPLDPPHVVALAEIPLGDQLAFTAASPVRFGQVPIGTSLTQTFAVVNQGNPGSPPAAFTLGIAGAGSAAYAVSPSNVGGLPPGGHVSGDETLTFSPGAAAPYLASVSLSTTDPLCAPLPRPLGLSGTGTQGRVSLSTTSIAFGTDPADPAGLVNCGTVGPARELTVGNVGNQALRITALSLGKGASSPFTLSGTGTTLPVTLGIGQSVTLTLTPSAIPTTVANPGDPTMFADVLTIATDGALDAPHVVTLVMQARGAVIANAPLSTSWDFGTITAGGIATFTSALQNLGNAAATVTLRGLGEPSVFGLAGSPISAPGGAVTPVVGQFTPPAASGTWVDQGVLVVSTAQAFCSPLPAGWNAPTIHLSGSSNASPPVTLAGALTFPTSECGSAAPAAQSITLSNATDAALAFEARLSSGAFYTLSTGAGVLPANGAASILVTPRTLTPGPGVQPGSAPYADNLTITVASTPPTTLTVPVAWTLDGAVLTLPEGAGPHVDAQGHAFYVADGTSGFALPLGNTGTGTASVSLAVQPPGAFVLSPAPPIAVLPGLGAAPQLASGPNAPACPTTLAGTATFLYSGAVCQPLPLASVSVKACAGTY